MCYPLMQIKSKWSVILFLLLKKQRLFQEKKIQKKLFSVSTEHQTKVLGIDSFHVYLSSMV